VRQRKTDYGTIILHWTFVAAFAVALVTGLRIATETPDRTWINWFDAVLPRDSVWVAHMQAAIVLVAVAIGYVVYMLRSGLGRRVQIDRVRLRGLFGRGQARLSAVIALMYWIFFVTMSGLLVSGGALYFGFYSGYDVAMLHWVGTWVILAFVVLHVLTQYKSGGVAQLRAVGVDRGGVGSNVTHDLMQLFHRAIEIRRLDSAGTSKHQHNCSQLAPAISRFEIKHCRESFARNQRDGRQCAFGAAHVVRDGRLRFAGCLR